MGEQKSRRLGCGVPVLDRLAWEAPFSCVPTRWTKRYDRLRELWQGVDPHEVCSVLAHVDSTGAPSVQVGIEEALSLSGVDAASALMAPIASAFGSVDRADRAQVLHAIDALIRAGGDPAPALGALAQGVGDGRTVQQACAGLHRAVLSGCSIAPVRETLAKASADGHSVRAVQRLDELQRRGKNAELRSLGAVYEQQRPMGNLLGGIGLVEESLLSADDAEVTVATLALAQLERAGSDFYRCWLAMLPVFNVPVRATDRGLREPVVAALGQVRFAIGKSPELDEREAARRVVPLLTPALDGLADLLGGQDSEGTAAAKVIEVFVQIGCSLSDVRPRVEAALGSAQVEVRSTCSRALSIALQRTGEETPLPQGRSHRRTYAAADTPLENDRTVRCPNCNAMAAVVIYESRDRGNTWDNTTIELTCSSCRIYSVEHFGL